MNLETFFEKFDLFADAPDAVAKMRELVLELAVRGRLLSSGKPASSVPSDSSAPFPIPHDWQWIALNKAADCRIATKVDSSSLNDSDWVLDLEDIDGGAGKVIATATFAERRSLSTKASFQKGDVLYGKLRPYLNKVVIAYRPGFCTTEIIPLRPQKFVEAGYLRLFLRSPHFLRYAAAKNYGMKMPRLGTQDLESAAIPLPPLAEQKRIVAKVDELMALCDRLEAQQQERETRHAALSHASLARFADAPTQANLQFLFHPSYAIPPADLRKSILTLAVQGKLVPQDPKDEPAEVAVGRIEEQRELLIAAKYFRRSQLPSIRTEGTSEIPESWVWSNLGNAMLNVTDGFHSTPQTVENGIRYVTAKHVKPGLIDFDSCLYVSEEDFNEIATKTRTRKGDVLVVNIGAGCGLASIIEVDYEFAFKNVAILNRPDDVDPQFLFNFLMSKRDDIFEERAKGGAQPFLSLGLIREIPFPLPPLAEQRRIVAKVDELMTLVDALETQLAVSRTTAANLLSALVTELTNQKGDISET